MNHSGIYHKRRIFHRARPNCSPPCECRIASASRPWPSTQRSCSRNGVLVRCRGWRAPRHNVVRYRYRCRGMGMDNFQGEIFTLDLSCKLPPLLAIHLVPFLLACRGDGFVPILFRTTPLPSSQSPNTVRIVINDGMQSARSRVSDSYNRPDRGGPCCVQPEPCWWDSSTRTSFSKPFGKRRWHKMPWF